jgi:phage terminase large subunit-like protein
MAATIKLKLKYGTDARGFYWPTSPQKRSELMSVKRGAPAAFEAVYQGRPGRREGAIFLESDFNYYIAPVSLVLGVVSEEVQKFIANGFGVFQSWDTAFSTTSVSAHSVCTTGLFVPCSHYHRDENEEYLGPCEFHFDVYILDVFREKLDWGGLTTAVKSQYAKWQPQAVLIENRATGISLIQSLNSIIPIQGVDVGASGKGARAINRVDSRSAGSVQGWFRQHRVLYPIFPGENIETGEPLRPEWFGSHKAEMKDFSGNDDASSDQVDSIVHLVTHAIRSGSTSTVLPSDWSAETAIQTDQMAETEMMLAREQGVDSRAAMLQILGEIEGLSDDPYDGTCARCKNYNYGMCKLWNRKTIAMDSCANFAESELLTA